MKNSVLILIVLLSIAIIGSGCEIKRSEEEIREEIKAELEAEQAAEELALEEAAKEAELKAQEEQLSNIETIENDKTLKIMTEKLNVRRDPVLDGLKLGSITNEKTYEFSEEEVRTDGYKWYKIMYEPDTEGWIAGWYTLKNSEFSDKIGRGNLIKAFDGKFDGMIHGIGDNIKAYIEGKGDADLVEGFNGGDVYVYGDLNIFTYGDMGGNIEIGDIAFITYSGADSMFGVQVGMTKDAVMDVIGQPDVIELDVTDDFDYTYTNNDIHSYYTGSYVVKFIYSAEGELERIEILGNS